MRVQDAVLVSYPLSYLQVFVLMLTRTTAMVGSMPILSSRGLPAMMKIGLAGMLALILLPVQVQHAPALPNEVWPFALALAQELLIGLLLGFASSLMFDSLQMAGQIVGLQIGLNVAAAIDPVSSSNQLSYIDQLYAIVAALIFFTINGHHWLIMAIQGSFELVPLNSLLVSPELMDQLIRLVGNLFVITVRVALPVLATLMLADLAMLIIARTVPQIQVFFLGIPIKVAAGFVTLLAAMPVTVLLMESVFRSLLGDLTVLLKLM